MVERKKEKVSPVSISRYKPGNITTVSHLSLSRSRLSGTFYIFIASGYGPRCGGVIISPYNYCLEVRPATGDVRASCVRRAGDVRVSCGLRACVVRMFLRCMRLGFIPVCLFSLVVRLSASFLDAFKFWDVYLLDSCSPK